MGTSERLQVRVNEELVLDAATFEEASGPQGHELLIHPSEITLSESLRWRLEERTDVTVWFESDSGFDRIKLQDGVMEPFRAA